MREQQFSSFLALQVASAEALPLLYDKGGGQLELEVQLR